MDEPTYNPRRMVDRDDGNDEILGEWRNQVPDGGWEDLGRLGANVAPRSANVQRNRLRDYVVSDVGERHAPWQWLRAFRGAFINE